MLASFECSTAASVPIISRSSFTFAREPWKPRIVKFRLWHAVFMLITVISVASAIAFQRVSENTTFDVEVLAYKRLCTGNVLYFTNFVPRESMEMLWQSL